MIKISNLSSGYNKKIEIVNNISFQIDDGEIGVLIGENGSGKSTILKSILNLIKPKSGEIFVDDININDLSNKQRAKYISYVSQNVIMPELPVYDVIMMGRIPYYNFMISQEDKKIVDDIIKELKLEDIKEKYANLLSGGEKQMVAIARAIAQEPKILIFDEPTSNLDIVNEIKLKNQILKITKEKNISTVITIHDLNLAYEIGDKFIFLKDGNIIDFGDKNVFTEENLFKTFNQLCKIKKIEEEIYIKFKEEN